MTDLEEKVRRLEATFAAFAGDLRWALDYVHSDVASSLTKSRAVMEKLLVAIFKTEMGTEPKKSLLGEMLNDNQFTRKVDRRILARINSIRDMGNLGPHGEVVEASDAIRVLDDLCIVLDWYLAKYATAGALPASNSASLDRMPLPSAAHSLGVYRDVVRPTLAIYYELGESLARVYASAIVIRLHLLDYTTARPDVREYVEEDLPSELHDSLAEVLVSFQRQRDALLAVNRDSLGRNIWAKTTSGLSVDGLRNLSATLQQHGLTESETSIKVTDLSGLAQFFTVAVNRLRGCRFAPLLTAVLMTNAAEPAGKGYDHAALRSLMFCGNLLFGYMFPSRTKADTQLVASFGSAMLLDLYHSLPDTGAVRDALNEMLPGSQREIDAMQIKIDPIELAGREFAFAVAALNGKRDLLLLELA